MTRKRPFVSVVVALYNEEDNLHMCTEALLRQRYPADRFEVLLVDDGSEDRSAEVCREIVEEHGDRAPSIRYVAIPHGGLSVARNSGIAASRGDIIAFIDADAAACEGWLEAIVGAFEDEGVGVVGGRIDPLNAEEALTHFFAAIHYDRSPVVGANMAYRPAVFEKVGGFIPVFQFRGDESNLVRRIRRESDVRIVHDEDARVDHWLPPTLGRWLRERWTTGRLWYWHRQVDLAFGGAAGTGSLAWMLYDRIANLAFLPLLIACAWSPSVPLGLVLVLTLPIIVGRYVFPGRLSREILAKLQMRFGSAKGLLYWIPGVLTIYLGSLADDLSFFRHAFANERVVPGEIPRPTADRETP